MALEAVHPTYTDLRSEWDKMRDIYKGERHVKEQGEKYLPVTKSMQLDGMGWAGGKPKLGQEVYNAYRTRAILPDYLEEAVEAFIGLLHSNPPVIELPPEMEPLREAATTHGESIELLMRRVNEEQLVTGRLGLLLDLPAKPDPAAPLPYIALYIAEAVRNWDDGAINDGTAELNMVVLDESGFKREGFNWLAVTKYRVLELNSINPDDATDTLDTRPDQNVKGTYANGAFETNGGGTPTYVQSDMKQPAIRGATLDEIPFEFVNSKDITPNPDKPPLLGLANLVLAIYRGEADYRQNLFMQGQDTLVVAGDRKKVGDANELASDEPLRTGSGSMIELEAGGTAEYVGVQSQGLAEQRTALENDRIRAESKSGQLVNNLNGDAESGAALQTRVAAMTASLNQIAKTGAGAIERLLKTAAKWMGLDPDKVTVTPNLEFADYLMTGDDLGKIMAAKAAGAPISLKSIHALMAAGNLTKLDYDAEKDEIDSEPPPAPPPGTTAGGDPTPAPNNTPPKNPKAALPSPKAQ